LILAKPLQITAQSFSSRIILHQGLGSLKNISQATIDEIIHKTPLKVDKAATVCNFFKEDSLKM